MEKYVIQPRSNNIMYTICCEFNTALISDLEKFFTSHYLKDFLERHIIGQVDITTSEHRESYIHIYLNSNGGDVDIAIAMYEVFTNMIKYQHPGIKIVIHMTGKIHSAAILFCGVGDYRVLYSGTSMLFHGVAYDSQKRSTEFTLQERVEIVKFYNNTMKKYYFASGYFLPLVDDLFADINTDRYLTHEEIIEGNIATHYSHLYT